MIYLASPYSHPNPAVMQWRHDMVLQATVKLLERGDHVFSPIVYSHVLSQSGVWSGDGPSPTTYAEWEALDEDFIDRSDRLFVLCIPGWRESVGVQAEISYALSTEVEIVLIAPSSYGIYVEEADNV